MLQLTQDQHRLAFDTVELELFNISIEDYR